MDPVLLVSSPDKSHYVSEWLQLLKVIGCLKYGAGVCGVHVSNQAAEVFLKDGSLNDGPDDEAFLQSLRRSLKTARGACPPVALAEIYQE